MCTSGYGPINKLKKEKETRKYNKILAVTYPADQKCLKNILLCLPRSKSQPLACGYCLSAVCLPFWRVPQQDGLLFTCGNLQAHKSSFGCLLCSHGEVFWHHLISKCLAHGLLWNQKTRLIWESLVTCSLNTEPKLLISFHTENKSSARGVH